MKRKHIIICSPTSKDGDPNMDGTTNNNNNIASIQVYTFNFYHLGF